MLKYPNDRYNGYVLLSDGDGNLFVPDFSRAQEGETELSSAIKYCGAFLVLAHRLDRDAV